MDYQEYKHDFLESLRNDSAISGAETEEEFLNRTLDILTDFNEIEDPMRVGMGDKARKNKSVMRIDGYSFDEVDRSLILFISDFQDSYTTDNLTMTRVDELYWRLYYFLDEVCNGSINDYFDDSDDVLKIARLIRKRVNASGDDTEMLLKIKFYIITNKELSTALLNTNLLETTIKKTKGKSKTTKTTKKIKKADFNGKPLEINLWHLERFYEMENSNNNDPIVIDVKNDFPELGFDGIPCIKGNIGEDLGYEAYIAIIPGKLLASIYIEHGSKVLEGNVRAFLGTNGSKSVNSGIKRTINTDPTKFFTYNNGIATTAADVEIAEINGETLITKMVDLQIINGGQTTASLAEAVLKRTNINLDGIFVPMKLTVIEDRETENDEGVRFYDEMVQAIAKYANSQNKVTAADLFSNDPFHIWMEKMSKKHLAPPAQYAVPTGWYYERSRKKYLQEQIKLRGEDAKRFTLKFPKKQIVNKEQLAMYLTTIDQKPHIVSKGKNWVMKEFGTKIGTDYRANKAMFNEFYFKKCICAAIIFRTVDNYLETNKDSAKRPTGFWYKSGGYKGNIVPYTIAKILSCIPKGYTLDWGKIWQKQAVSPAFMREVEKVTKMTNDFICDSHGVIVTEYCKRPTTWDEYRDKVKYELSPEFVEELMPESIMK
ncbi:MAG: AIPR family protein, partial [Clostridia bacterium]|nr:AIPR family protein [Clostridia bacterium]